MPFRLPDVPLQFAFLDGLQKMLQLFGIARSLQLDPPIWQVFHPARHVIPASQLPHTIAKTHPLHSTLIKHLYPFHESSINPAILILPAKKVFPPHRIRYTSPFQPHFNALVSHASLY